MMHDVSLAADQRPTTSMMQRPRPEDPHLMFATSLSVRCGSRGSPIALTAQMATHNHATVSRSPRISELATAKARPMMTCHSNDVDQNQLLAADVVAAAREWLTSHVKHTVRHTAHSVCTTQPLAHKDIDARLC